MDPGSGRIPKGHLADRARQAGAARGAGASVASIIGAAFSAKGQLAPPATDPAPRP
jgi:hypothetical protein